VSSEARRALAFVTSSVVYASSTILAYLLLASIVFVLTTDTRVICRTTAVQAGTEVLALATMHTRISDAAFWGSFAVLAIRATGTHAEVVLEQVNATGVVLARSLRSTSGNLLLAAHSTPTRFTATLKATDAISAESIVQAGLCLSPEALGTAGVEFGHLLRESQTGITGNLADLELTASTPILAHLRSSDRIRQSWTEVGCKIVLNKLIKNLKKDITNTY